MNITTPVEIAKALSFGNYACKNNQIINNTDINVAKKRG